jgi:hypothetical protein
MGVFIFKSDKDLAKPRHAVTKQDLQKMFIDAVRPKEVKDLAIDFKNGVASGLCADKLKEGEKRKKSDWKLKKIRFIEVVKTK